MNLSVSRTYKEVCCPSITPALGFNPELVISTPYKLAVNNNQGYECANAHSTNAPTLLAQSQVLATFQQPLLSVITCSSVVLVLFATQCI